MEIWKDVIGLENNYQISNIGRIKSKTPRYKNKEFLKTQINTFGYVTIKLFKKTYFFHKIIAKAFIPNNKNKPFINHIDGNKQNNKIENLEWCTASENNFHACRTGLAGGVKHNKSKLNEQDIAFIRTNYKPYDEVYGEKNMALKYNMSSSAIANIVNGKYYKFEGGKIRTEKFKLNDEAVKYIKSKYIPYDKTYGATPLSKKFNVSIARISTLCKNKKMEVL